MKISCKAFIRGFLAFWLSISVNHATAQNKTNEGAASAVYFTIESYYRVKWGSAEEFISLWKKNHYPLLKKAREKGDIIRISAEKPILHSGEDTRWDFKVTIVFRNAQSALVEDVTAPFKAQLYPDATRLAQEEQHRFELLLSHWDVMIENINLQD